MDTETLLRAFCDAVEQRNGKAFAELFTEGGIYRDVFYGGFEGRAKIADMIDDVFYRTATDFRWDMHAPVSDGHHPLCALHLQLSFDAAGSQGRAGDVRGRLDHAAA